MGTFTVSGAAIRKAGANISTDLTTGAESTTFWNEVIRQVESQINTATRLNWIDVFSGLDEDDKYILEECASNLAAIYGIEYDMAGYTSRGEAESMITVLRDAALRLISILRDIKSQEYLGQTD